VPFPESHLAAAYIQGDLDHASGSQSSVTRIVIHGTVSKTQPGGARANARYFQSPEAGGLAHYVVDPGEIIQCAPESTVVWHAPPNEKSIGIELCDPQGNTDVSPDAADPARWNDAPHQAMLTLAAALVRDVAARWNVPLTFVDASALRGGAQGITEHLQVARAWQQSDHTDPTSAGPWPRDAFMAALNNTAPTPTAPPEDDDMLSSYRNTDTGAIVTAGPGHWRPIESPAYYNLDVARGVCKPYVEVNAAEFGYFQAVFMSSEFNDQAMRAELDKIAAAVKA
jgi:N-acetyl-anhydromuramyl-L-alanine amidase AmpD